MPVHPMWVWSRNYVILAENIYTKTCVTSLKVSQSLSIDPQGKLTNWLTQHHAIARNVNPKVLWSSSFSSLLTTQKVNHSYGTFAHVQLRDLQATKIPWNIYVAQVFLRTISSLCFLPNQHFSRRKQITSERSTITEVWDLKVSPKGKKKFSSEDNSSVNILPTARGK